MSSVKSIHDDLFDNVFVTDSASGSESESVKEHMTLDDLKESSLDLVDMTNSFEFSKINDAKTATIKSGSTCSSRTSHTSSGNEGEGDGGNDDETGSENGSESDGLEKEDGKEEKDGEEEKEGQINK